MAKFAVSMLLYICAGFMQTESCRAREADSFRIFEFGTIEPSGQVSTEPLIWLRYKNQSRTPYEEKPYFGWYWMTEGYFMVYQDGKQIPDPLSHVDYAHPREITFFFPGEWVTMVLPLSKNARLAKDPAERVGCYELRPHPFQDWEVPIKEVLCPKRCQFEVRLSPKPAKLGVEKIASDEEVVKVAAIINSPVLYPSEKYTLLQMAVAYGKKEAIWRLIAKCDDTYALVNIMVQLPPELLDKEGLFALLPSMDLSIRRAALQTFAKLGKDEAAAKRLEEFVRTQKDEMTVKFGERSARALRGEEVEPLKYIHRFRPMTPEELKAEEQKSGSGLHLRPNG